MNTLIRNYALTLIRLETPESERVARGVAQATFEADACRDARLALEAAGATAELIEDIRENPMRSYCDAATARYFN